jgi:hypothetical protein
VRAADAERSVARDEYGSLTYDKLVPRLVEAVPEVPLDPADIADNLVYLVFNDLMRFVNTTIEAEGNTEVLTRIFSFIEAAAQTKTSKSGCVAGCSLRDCSGTD